MTSMLPVVTISVFGIKRGTEVYGYMFSVFGVASMAGLVIVGTLQHTIGYEGMLVVCLIFTGVAAVFSYFYKFNESLSYAELLGYIEKGTSTNLKDEERGFESPNSINKPMLK